MSVPPSADFAAASQAAERKEKDQGTPAVSYGMRFLTPHNKDLDRIRPLCLTGALGAVRC